MTAVTAPGLTRLVEAETAYRAAIRVVQTSAEIEPYLVAVIARSGAFESFFGHGFPGHRLFFVNSFPRNLYLSDICQMAVKPRGFMGRLRRQPRPPFRGFKMPADVENAFDIAFWFADTALNENQYLQPQKLQRLLFIAQAYYTVAFNGRKLMPAVFVADEMGPIEPNIYLAFSKGRPEIDARLFLPHDVETFLEGIWRRFGHHSAERLNKMIKETTAYKQAYKNAPRTEIPLDAMRLSFARAEKTPGVAQVVKPKILRTQSGKAVTVKAWVPGTTPAAKK